MPYKDKEKAREFARKYQNERHSRLRKEVIASLGGKCALCGISDERVLVIDHLKPIKRVGCERSGWETISRIYQGKEDMSNVQLLCANCHMIKTVDEQRAKPTSSNG